jgi:hypothetical protein
MPCASNGPLKQVSMGIKREHWTGVEIPQSLVNFSKVETN